MTKYYFYYYRNRFLDTTLHQHPGGGRAVGLTTRRKMTLGVARSKRSERHPALQGRASGRGRVVEGTERAVRWLTVHVHVPADVGAPQGVGHLAGHGLGKEGVVHHHLVAVARHLGDRMAALGPSVEKKTQPKRNRKTNLWLTSL